MGTEGPEQGADNHEVPADPEERLSTVRLEHSDNAKAPARGRAGRCRKAKQDNREAADHAHRHPSGERAPETKQPQPTAASMPTIVPTDNERSAPVTPTYSIAGIRLAGCHAFSAALARNSAPITLRRILRPGIRGDWRASASTIPLMVSPAGLGRPRGPLRAVRPFGARVRTATNRSS